MERKFYFTVLVVLSFALFAGCGSKSEKAQSEGNDTENVGFSVTGDENEDEKNIANKNDIFEAAENMNQDAIEAAEKMNQDAIDAAEKMNQDAIDAAEKMMRGLSKGTTNEMRKAQKEAAEEMRKAMEM